MSVRVHAGRRPALMLVGLGILIGDTTDLEVVGEAGGPARGSAPGARTAAGRRSDGHPDASIDGIEATRQATAEPDPPQVLVLTTFDDDEYVYGALRAGAKRIPAQKHGPGRNPGRDPRSGGRRRVDRTERHPTPDRRLRRNLRHPPQPPHRTPSPPRTRISSRESPDREREVLALVGQGLSNPEIRRAAGDQRGDGEDPRRATVRQARGPGPASTWRSSPTRTDSRRVADRAGFTGVFARCLTNRPEKRAAHSKATRSPGLRRGSLRR